MAEKKALGGLSNMKEFIKACFAEGNTIESRMKKAKRKFIRIDKDKAERYEQLGMKLDRVRNCG